MTDMHQLWSLIGVLLIFTNALTGRVVYGVFATSALMVAVLAALGLGGFAAQSAVFAGFNLIASTLLAVFSETGPMRVPDIGLTGRRAVAESAFHQDLGTAVIGNTRWPAICLYPVEAGESLIVTGREDFNLIVEPLWSETDDVIGYAYS